MGWCQDPSQELVELGMVSSLPWHACGGTCQHMLARENKTHFRTPELFKKCGSLTETDTCGIFQGQTFFVIL